jgi:DNA-binding Xre family transcriptional regulator
MHPNRFQSMIEALETGGLSVSQIAQRAAISRSNLHRLKNGRRRVKP